MMNDLRDFETIDVPGIGAVPIVTAFDRDGKPVPLRGDLEPEQCDHAGASYSASLALRCPRCGIPMFLPPRKLAHLPGDIVDVMHDLWAAAGWPEWWRDGWHYKPEYWTMTEHVLFPDGLPVCNGRLSLWQLAIRWTSIPAEVMP